MSGPDIIVSYIERNIFLGNIYLNTCHSFCVEIPPFSQWSEHQVADWLETLKNSRGLNIDVDNVRMPGDEFSHLTVPHLERLTGDAKAAIRIFNAKEATLLKEYKLKEYKDNLKEYKKDFPEFRINDFEVTDHEIPGYDQAVSILDFGESAEVDPPFMIVHDDIRGELERWVKEATKEDRREKSICVINGLVKTGKTAALTYVLPSLVRQYEPDAEFCHLDFEKFMEPYSDRHDIAKDLLLQLEAWARANGFHVSRDTYNDTSYANIKYGLQVIMNRFRGSGRKIYFLFDEVQRFFQVVDKPDHNLFKALLNVGHWNGGLRFAFTGSGMVRAWTEIAKCPANGTTVGARSRSLNLPATDPLPVLDYATERLLRHYEVDNSSEIHKLLSTMPSVASRSYFMKEWMRSGSEAEENVNLKFQEEFKADMLPLLEEMHSKGQKQYLLELRKLAAGTATEHPKSCFPHSIYHYFFKHYVEELCSDDGKTTYGFSDTPFATLVLQHIDEGGNVAIPSTQNVLKYRYHSKGVSELTQTIGEDLKPAIATKAAWKKKHQEITKQTHSFFKRVEEITKGHCEYYGFDIDAAMPGLLEWKNDHLSRQLDNGGWHASSMKFPYCSFLYALRNSWSHPYDRSDECTNRIIMEYCPHFWSELKDDIEKAKSECFIPDIDE